MNGSRPLVSPKRVTLILVLVVLCLTSLSIVSSFVMDSRCRLRLIEKKELHIIEKKEILIKVKFKRIEKHLQLGGPILKKFTLYHEGKIPTFYSTFALLLSSALIGIIAFAKKREGAPYRLHWKAMSVIFLYLSMDEAAQLHEMTVKPLRSALNASGFLYYTWVIPGGLFVLIFILAYLRFLADLPKKTRNLFLVAGALFVGGALGMEMISGYYRTFYTGQTVPLSLFCKILLNRAMLSTVEEILEMLGIVVFIYALMSYISLHVKVRVTLIE